LESDELESQSAEEIDSASENDSEEEASGDE